HVFSFPQLLSFSVQLIALVRLFFVVLLVLPDSQWPLVLVIPFVLLPCSFYILPNVHVLPLVVPLMFPSRLFAYPVAILKKRVGIFDLLKLPFVLLLLLYFFQFLPFFPLMIPYQQHVDP